jgi:hypothetical protein
MSMCFPRVIHLRRICRVREDYAITHMAQQRGLNHFVGLERDASKIPTYKLVSNTRGENKEMKSSHPTRLHTQ